MNPYYDQHIYALNKIKYFFEENLPQSIVFLRIFI